jgi:hypothetical protein
MIIVNHSGVVAAPQTPVVVADHRDKIAIKQPPKVIVSVLGARGPRGLSGGSGSTQLAIASRPGFETPALAVNRVVGFTNTGLQYAGSDTTYFIAGFTIGTTYAGETVYLSTSGELTGFSGLEAGKPVFLGLFGEITQTVPVTGRSQVVGFAHADDRIIIDIQNPVFKNSDGAPVSIESVALVSGYVVPGYVV